MDYMIIILHWIFHGKRSKIRDISRASKRINSKCWDAIPENHPTPEEVMNEIRYYMYGNSYLAQVKRFEELPVLTYNFTPITKSTTKIQLARLLAEKNNSGTENEQLSQQIIHVDPQLR
ncbi:hypothetical protein C1645_741181 [Glomus cerebriforme]|uniref:Uncharacterized protein n=1 Tax=Glomus cerebriforme TaxID=658196 RepID=A0A397SK04_9GLOM|nr:hypothetical protein C1645_741181 [Glomus cerebriforme]